MVATRAGGLKARQTNSERYDKEYLKKYGMTFYQYLGHLGGKKSRDGGFASKEVGLDGLTGPQRAAIVGVKGGRIGWLIPYETET